MKSALLLFVVLIITMFVAPGALAQWMDPNEMRIAQDLVREGYYTKDQIRQALAVANKLNSYELNDAKALVRDGIISTLNDAAKIVERSDVQDRSCARLHLDSPEAHGDFVMVLHLCQLSRWDD